MTYNLIGFKNYQLTVIAKHSEKDKNKRTQWLVRCLCGNERLFRTYELTGTAYAQKCCGNCQWHIKHKEAYISWMGMKQRCNDPSRKDYESYGGRGIKYQSSWVDFVEFYKDMGDPPLDSFTMERLSLDRINNDGDYTKENCKWSTRSEQQLNKIRKIEDKQST